MDISMFLMFTLCRADVLPLTDLGNKKGIMKLYDFKELPTPKQMMEKSKSWQPYQTIAAWYLWSVLENN